MPEINKPLQPDQIEAYVRHTTQLLELPIPPEQMADVVENFERVHTIAQQILEFTLPDDLEAAPRFEP
ncbi:MAG: DUF4089 domain-containing protein [Cyanobacteria bacterium J06607_17]